MHRPRALEKMVMLMVENKFNWSNGKSKL